jgi:carbon storage regulator
MLCLSRREGERIFVGPNIVIEIVKVCGGQVRLGISAPREINVIRGELACKDTPNDKAN